MPRGKVGDVLGQPRREGYSCLDSHSGSGARVLGDVLTSVRKVFFPGTQGDGEPLSSISRCTAFSSGPVVDGADGTVESVRGLVEGASGCIQAVFNSNHLSVSRVHLDTSREGFVEEFDGVEGLFLGHIGTGGSTGDSAPDVTTLAIGGWGKAVPGGEGSELIHAGEVSNSLGLSHVSRVVAVQFAPESRASRVNSGSASVGMVIVSSFGNTKFRAIPREGSVELDGRGNGGGGNEAGSFEHL